MGKHLTFDCEPKRAYQVRVCPIDFADTFVRGGWRGVEERYGFNTTTNRRCVQEAGGDDLVQKRRAHLAQVRQLRKSIQHRHDTAGPVQEVAADVQRAIIFLRSRDGGSWLITATGKGDFYFGATRMTGEALVERARRKGLVG